MTEDPIDEQLEAPLDPETEAMIDRALADARDFYDDEVATSVRFVMSENIFVLTLRSGRRVLIAREDLQDVCDATAEQAADVQLDFLDTSLHWPQIDVAFSVKGLADGRFGSEDWMRRLAKRRSPAMAA